MIHSQHTHKHTHTHTPICETVVSAQWRTSWSRLSGGPSPLRKRVCMFAPAQATDQLGGGGPDWEPGRTLTPTSERNGMERWRQISPSWRGRSYKRRVSTYAIYSAVFLAQGHRGRQTRASPGTKCGIWIGFAGDREGLLSLRRSEPRIRFGYHALTTEDLLSAIKLQQHHRNTGLRWSTGSSDPSRKPLWRAAASYGAGWVSYPTSRHSRNHVAGCRSKGWANVAKTPIFRSLLSQISACSRHDVWLIPSSFLRLLREKTTGRFIRNWRDLWDHKVTLRLR